MKTIVLFCFLAINVTGIKLKSNFQVLNGVLFPAKKGIGIYIYLQKNISFYEWSKPHKPPFFTGLDTIIRDVANVKQGGFDSLECLLGERFQN